MQKKSLLMAAAALVGSATLAIAAVIFDPATGTGWVGKGDVQTAFGWNNAAMQRNHLAITFEYDATTTYTWTCQWTTGPDQNQTLHTQPRTKTHGVAGTIGNTDRRTGQWTGWFLTGYTDGGPDAGSDDFVPTCPGNEGGDGNSGGKTVVEGSLESTSSGGGLFAVYNGDRRQIN